MIQPNHKFMHDLNRTARPVKRIVVLLLAAILALPIAFPGQASDRAFDEYQVKAVFLYRLALFVTWPEVADDLEKQPFTIAILGDDPFGAHLDRVVKDETFKGRPVQVRRFRSMEEVKQTSPQVLFVNRSLKQRWPKIKQTIEKLHVLTVSDMDTFCALGGMITIKTRANKIQIEINPDETRKVGLKISSKLLRISRQVTTAAKGGQQ